MTTSDAKNTDYLINLITAAGTVCVLILLFWSYKHGYFSSVETLQKFIVGFGIWAPIVFILIQIIQVIVPIVPGAISCVAGILIFGNMMGFVYNYIGICIGSIAVFILSKKYGSYFVRKIIGQKNYDKFIKYIDDENKFSTLFSFAIFFPVAPDDILCYIAGLTKMKLKKFITVILLCKPASIAIYSMGLTVMVQNIYKLIF
ncbi:MAG: TVP38/TMEM64 family protein [Sedimentibacter sp.]